MKQYWTGRKFSSDYIYIEIEKLKVFNRNNICDEIKQLH